MFLSLFFKFQVACCPVGKKKMNIGIYRTNNLTHHNLASALTTVVLATEVKVSSCYQIQCTSSL